MIFLVFLRDAEVDVEQQEARVVERFRLAAREQLGEPFRVDELVVVRQAIYWELDVCRPFLPTRVVDPHIGQAVGGQARRQIVTSA